MRVVNVYEEYPIIPADQSSLRPWRLNLMQASGDRLFIAVGNQIRVFLLSLNAVPRLLTTLQHPSPKNAPEMDATDAFPSPFNVLRTGSLLKQDVLIAADDAGQLCIWDAKSFRSVMVLEAHASTWGLAIHDQRQLVAASSNAREITVWRLDSGEYYKLLGHEHNIPNIEFSPCGMFLGSCSVDKTVRVWNLESRSCIYTTTPASNRSHSANSWMWAVGFLPKELDISDEVSTSINFSNGTTSISSNNEMDANRDEYETDVPFSENMEDEYGEETEHETFSSETSSEEVSSDVDNDDHDDDMIEYLDAVADSDLNSEDEGVDVFFHTPPETTSDTHVFPYLIICSSQTEVFLIDISNAEPLIRMNAIPPRNEIEAADLEAARRTSRPSNNFFQHERLSILEIQERYVRNQVSLPIRLAFICILRDVAMSKSIPHSLSLFGTGMEGLVIFADQKGDCVLVKVSRRQNNNEIQLKVLCFISPPLAPISMLSGLTCVPQPSHLPSLSFWRIFLLYQNGLLSCFDLMVDDEDGKVQHVYSTYHV